MVRSGCGAAAVLGVAVLLAGCTARAAPPSPSPPAAAPAFPRVGGAVLSADSPVAGDWRIRVRIADPDAAYPRVKALLTGAGYVLTKDRDGRGGGDGQACTTRLCVSFSATVDPEHGPSVLYEVFRPSGIVG